MSRGVPGGARPYGTGLYTAGVTSAFLATVGNDSLPVMTGLAWALQDGRSFEHVLLLGDEPDDRRWAGQRQRLHTWIARTCPHAQVRTVTLDDLTGALRDGQVQQVTVNITGGSKALALQTAAAAQAGPWTADVIVVDAHTHPDVLIRRVQTSTTAAPLDLRDVLDVYAPDATIVKTRAPSRILDEFSRTLPTPTRPTLIDWQRHRYAAALIGSVLHVLWLPTPDQLHLTADQRHLRTLRQRVLELGGQLARGYVPNLDTFIPAGTPASQLAALRSRQRGLTRTLNLRRIPEPAAQAHRTGPDLPPPPPSGAAHVLLSLLGEQPIPTLRDVTRLHAAGTLGHVELLVTTHPAVRATARRLAAWGDRNGVRVYARPVDAADPTSVTDAVRAALNATHVTLNLTGGTKGMALAALDATRHQGHVTVTLTRGRTVHLLGGAALPTPPLTVPLEDLLALHGVHIHPNEPLARPPLDPDVDHAARQLLRGQGNAETFTTLVQSRLNLTTSGARGFALEYLAYAALKRTYPTADVTLGAKIHPVTYHGEHEQAVTGSSDHERVGKEVDVLACVNGEMVAVEAKWRLDSALVKHQEHLDSGQFGWDLGRLAHVAIVSVEFREARMKTSAAAADRSGLKQSYWLHQHETLSSTAREWVRPFDPAGWAVLGDSTDLRL